MISMAFGFGNGSWTSLFLQYGENAIINHSNNVSCTIFSCSVIMALDLVQRQRKSCLRSELNVGRETTENNTRDIRSKHLSIAFNCILARCTQQQLQHGQYSMNKPVLFNESVSHEWVLNFKSYWFGNLKTTSNHLWVFFTCLPALRWLMNPRLAFWQEMLLFCKND